MPMRRSAISNMLFLSEMMMNWAFFVCSCRDKHTQRRSTTRLQSISPPVLKPRHTHVDVTSDNGDIFEVQSSIDLVHEVERRGFVVVQSKHQSQGAEGLLSSRQVEDLFPALLWGTDTKNDQKI